MNLDVTQKSFLKGIDQIKRDHQSHGQFKAMPVHKWDPPYCGEIEIRISTDGNWYYQNSVIKRHSMVKLFSSILKREANGEYFLVTPVEKVKIKVAKAPFIAIGMDVSKDNNFQKIYFTTNVGELVLVNEKHPVRIVNEKKGVYPYIYVRDNLEALLSRSVYYQLMEIVVEEKIDGEFWNGFWSDKNFIKILKK